ncbi:transketolase domain-containing protein [mine drainage metagenome]|uniref:Transketolase domain-containing protein n=1 Tax=mine drainage metagenome TaxID=410659 RepID=T1C5S9_9ZZZZ
MAVSASSTALSGRLPRFDTQPDWQRVTRLLQQSRALDDIEETRLLPSRQVLYQFSARGHDLAQILLGLQLTDPHDGVSVYYRSRPLMLAVGVDWRTRQPLPLARSGGVQRRP